MPKVKYLETPLTNDKGIREESKRNYLLPISPQSFDCPFAIYKHKIKICSTNTIFCCFVWGETWSLTVRKENRLKFF